ncbi:hypothetical protein NQ166_08335 [Microbacterium sp. zg.Y1090]|uniref:hypothetical protein n=1 Tax=Microbacterium TaxID=33882 RepID=UPI00214C8EB9|nr:MULTISPECIES: hypothetical protein [unclassified Microbacterium]MCR2811726.1 hypothetical protein [Microbacterium sp. zg.Y1084]MCR2818836.1 hypothetical protein [Microbacterium sp. zg.Y1090]MDL5486927.1 hypothetical protein [Microbacterium sp. zg-Y1211]WIM27149.1 hypothetical protein QNO26_08145 [Microbacterium sp. zg-Y1090]
MNLASITAFAAAETEHHVGLFDNVGYGIVALAIFLLLGLVTLSYRNVANRHAPKAEAYARAHREELTQAGHGHH